MNAAPRIGEDRAVSFRAEVEAAIGVACGRIAPLWPLDHFVAVNPLFGFADQPFPATCATLRRVAGVELVMPRAFYRAALETGDIEDADLETALARVPAEWQLRERTVAALRSAALRGGDRSAKPAAAVATVAEVLDRLAAGDRHSSRTAFMIDEISKWCAAYFDEGQAAWMLPWKAESPFRAWRATMRHDRNPEVMGIAGFRELLVGLPEGPVDAIVTVVERLGIPRRAVADYLYRALLDIQGWAAHARYLRWQSELAGRADETLVELLAIRVVWGYTLFAARKDAVFQEAWRLAMREAASAPDDARLGDDPELALDLVLHSAYEFAHQRRLLARLAVVPNRRPTEPGSRPRVQAAFCIDVRSEVYRRALERAFPGAVTLGFAGFFGFPIEYVPLGQEHGAAHCPALLEPSVVVRETVIGASSTERRRVLDLRLLRRRVARAWKAFKVGAVSSFAYVETLGVLYAWKLVSDSLHTTRPVAAPGIAGLDPAVASRLGPEISPGTAAGRPTGFDTEQGIAMAEAVLRGMSLTRGFAPLVLLVGHGSTTVNNPYASSLHCGACGGHTGEANARVAAAILNDPAVRAGLGARGIEVPDDTWFQAALHDTTTDVVTLFETGELSASHRSEFDALRAALVAASSAARDERARHFSRGAGSASRRSRDWSEVRPEWGLAGNVAFVAAPRARTRGLDLEGRVFLHEYEWREDHDGLILERILTAPMIVASWISLQYYASTVNHRVFGSGSKLLHNVVGNLGVLQGSGGDLKVGLPWESVHDGRRFVHEPRRLSVLIDAPQSSLEAAISRHTIVRQLLEGSWIHLFRMTSEGGFDRYLPGGRWCTEMT
jgi:uncharacterized protein YbcC (UPF0753/DUF2309 family)